jgi:hypothetical protein
MRNSVGQSLEIGLPVMVISQGQGWVSAAFGRIEKFSKAGLPQVRYDYKDGTYDTSATGKVSPPLQRYERIIVIPQDMYDELVDTHRVLADAQKEWKEVPTPARPTAPWNHSDWSTYRDQLNEHEVNRKEFINAAMNAAGKEDYYD